MPTLSGIARACRTWTPHPGVTICPSYAEYALRDRARSHLGINAFLKTLRPPDRDPPRLASLSVEQEGLIREMLEVLAFSSDSAYQAEACQVLEEWWIENPLYRNPSSDPDE
jgi:hypothetical protein